MTRRASGVAVVGVLIAALAMPRPGYAERTDVVTLANDDRLTGDIKELQRGRLRLKTDNAGTIQIEWEEVVGLVSTDTFEVEVETGERYYGSLDVGPEKATLSVIAPAEAWLLVMEDVVLITPLGATFFAQLDGSFDMGLTFASANNTTIILKFVSFLCSQNKMLAVHQTSINRCGQFFRQ